MTYEYERIIAVQAVLKASRLCKEIRTSLSSEGSIEKQDKSPVTIADFGSQAVITHELMSEFKDPIMAEEDSSILRSSDGKEIKQKLLENVNCILPDLTENQILSSLDRGKYEGDQKGRYWALDPTDGTKGFLRGGQYAIALALIEDGEVVLGVLGCPNLPIDNSHSDAANGCVFIAVKGQGAHIRSLDDDVEKKIKVSDIDDPYFAEICESVESAHSSLNDSEKIRELLRIESPPIRMDSQCKYGVLARGEASIYLRIPTNARYMEKVWDHAAGWIVVNEAGGQVTDVLGNPLNFSVGRNLDRNKGIVATNNKLHSRVIEAVRKVLHKKEQILS
ncbi:3'(2'),5'-bisphosphate nucleotidase [Desulfobacterota bacterium AH_259_B03_O07]|nr:3'(2'),5'-bisphosphate nucleotidase [Desulfobacterota bacterium AH_259_B03_O07]